MKLLYAEDEAAMSEAVTDILTYHKYSVDTVDNGRDALDYARNERYDGIILDVMMPNMSGFEVLNRLRAEGNTTPVLPSALWTISPTVPATLKLATKTRLRVNGNW